ncbi:uncharacterized protein TrAtP1_000470 [Trichoderma atroviride]|uniref:uncharacterized protein n=1 Tax=Hypocrea atroviridis TaxID=63577 RepID=UPI00331BF1BC|nr:hypothetical protein TrAtP1_000470 [Trichoderma atroviride]
MSKLYRTDMSTRQAEIRCDIISDRFAKGPLQALKQCGNAGVQRVWMVDAALDFGAWPPTQATAQAVQRICVE